VLVFDAVPDGVHTLDLLGLPVLCEAAGGLRREVTLAGDTVAVAFRVSCLFPAK
jgi:hypothetical protein